MAREEWIPTGVLLVVLLGVSQQSRSEETPGDRLATVSADQTVKLWQLDGKVSKTLKAHKQAVYGVSFFQTAAT